MRWLFIIKEGLLGFKRARLATLISIVTMALALTLVGIFSLGVVNLAQVFQETFQRIQLEVFLDPSLSQDNIEKTIQKIQALPEVHAVQYISPDEALKAFEKDFGADLISVLSENPLPPTCRVELKKGLTELETVDRVVSTIKQFPGVDDVLFQREIVRLINRYFFLGAGIALALGIIIFLISILLVFNTIRLTIHGRQTVIEIMKLVGATPAFIKSPFIIEGILQGVLGGLLADGFLLILINLSRSLLGASVAIPSHLLGVIIFLGALLGLIGSYFSVNKYLKL